MRRFTYPLLCVLCLSLTIDDAAAELRPDEVAIVCARDSRESRMVAAYYARVRQVPTENILALTMPKGDTLSREDWETKVRPVVRRWMSDAGRKSKIRCFVTVWDVPLKISAAKSAPDVQRLLAYLNAERKQRVSKINEFIQVLQQLAGTDDPAPAAIALDAKLEDVKGTLDQSFGAAQAGVGKITDPTLRTEALQRLQTVYFRSVGLNMMSQSLQRQIEAGGAGINAQVRTEYDVTRGRTVGLREGRAAVEGIPYGLDREPQLLAILQLSDGLYGSLAWIDEQINVLTKNESYASFDSELSLVAWPDYVLIRWQPNYLHYRYDESPIAQFKPIYMVSRIEAPTLKLTRNIIDQAMEVEKTGLQGKVYFDGRAAAQPGYQQYDQALVKAADLIKQHTNLEVVLDMKQELLQPGSAPDAALYCGWYSLGKYIDAFDWAPGAIGYHMASSEATTLRAKNSQVWCKRMLEDGDADGTAGVVATLGPVYEPYISAFPPPNEFFALLLSGKYSLVESYYRCLPFTSWTMTLVGDPLYSPFKAAPPLQMDGVDELTKRIVNGPISLLDPNTDGASAETTNPTATVE